MTRHSAHAQEWEARQAAAASAEAEPMLGTESGRGGASNTPHALTTAARGGRRMAMTSIHETDMGGYEGFLQSKRADLAAAGIEVEPTALHPELFPFQEDLVRWALRKGRAAIFADCVAGSTILQGPDGDERIDVLAERGEPIRVWALSQSGEVVAAQATAPFCKGEADLYRFTLASGRSIEVTERHRFLTPDGWTFAGDLRPGARLLVSDASRLQSSSDSDPSGFQQDGRYSVRTHEGWMGRCSLDRRQHDEQPLPGAGACLTPAPSRGGALEHIPSSSCEDGRGHRSSRIHPGRSNDLLSTMDYAVQGNCVVEAAGYPLPSCAPKQYPASTQIGPPTASGSTPGRLVPEPRPSAEQCSVDVLSSASVAPFFDTVVCISYIATDAYYDLHVPGYQNYLANGIWSHNTGLGKTLMQAEWARLCEERVLILAPLSVARQTVREAAKFGITVTYARRQEDAAAGITITNYEMVDHFEPAEFGAVVLDESSILKSMDGKTRTKLIELFGQTPMRLCCTATPAPNDIAELANHAEFLGVMSRVEMLATFFVHDDAGWRLKGHAREPFYRWLASWGMSLKRPSDLGYEDNGFLLPALSIEPVIIEADQAPAGRLFNCGLKGIQDRAATRKATLAGRVEAAAALINDTPGEAWLAWVGLNDEGRELARAVPGALLVEGADSPEAKAEAMERFVSGEARVLVSKVSICGFGMNFQHCARMAFVGLSDSYEQYYQAIRRCWRFGQTRPVTAYVVLSDAEEAIYANVLRKEQQAQQMSEGLVRHVAEYKRAEVRGSGGRTDYTAGESMRLPAWLKAA